MQISDRIKSLSPSLTLQLVARTKELRAAGRDVVTLGAGEPDFPTPANVCEAAIRAIEAGCTKYTEVPGILELRRAVAVSYEERFGLEYAPSDVLVSPGAKYCLFQALQVLVNPGDSVLIPTPSWLSYPEMVKAASGVPVTVPCSDAAGFKLDPGDLATHAEATGARVLVLNGVSNPTGCVHSAEELRAVAEVCVDLGIAVISDEIYEHLVYPPAQSTAFAASHPDVKDLTITVSGVSKTFAMTGWRIGYAVGPSNVIGAMRKLQGQSTSNACSIAQYAALEALTGDQSEVHHMREEFERRRDRMVELLRGIPDVTVPEPEGAFYAFPRVDAYYGRRAGIDDSLSLAGALLEEANLVVVPGKPFGDDAHIRLSYACSMEDLEKGVGRLADFLETLR